MFHPHHQHHQESTKGKGLKAPVVLFTYFNPILKKGINEFCTMAKDAGASGLLVPDLPLEETESIRKVSE